jgi:hypothetical protein
MNEGLRVLTAGYPLSPEWLSLSLSWLVEAFPSCRRGRVSERQDKAGGGGEWVR